MLTLDKLVKEYKPFHNDICILYDTTLVRLVGVAETPVDYYYLVRSIDHHYENLQDENKQWYASAIGHIISLKNIYPKEHYDRLDGVFSANGAKKTDEFLVLQHNGESL